ncbi:S41 family peptidase [Dyella sp.]|uniref:S41 family peptidase n=1 Tax=Dyella sp. TaxID=1869338 RepID=UPI002841B12C|nr:S41 family peptidase [Dyella sp.]MDR3447499.1 S41 family peptidase [Dyella sp.]
MRYLLLVGCLLPFSLAFAQPQSPSLQPAATRSVVQTLIGALDNYVFSAKAKSIQAYLRAHEAVYMRIDNAEALASRLTDDLRSIGNDKHFRVRYSDVADAESSTETDQAEMLREHEAEEANAMGIRSVTRLPGNVGYLKLSYFSNDPESSNIVAAAMWLLQGSDALIIDLRHNQGGTTSMLDDLLAYFFVDQQKLRSVSTRSLGKISVENGYTSLYTPAPRFIDKPLFVLTDSRTFSAGEECAYDLQALKRATLVGETTAGGANPGSDHDLGNRFEVFIPTGLVSNPITKANWEGVGVTPDVPVSAAMALEMAYTLALKASTSHVADPDLDKARAAAIADPKAALKKVGFEVQPQGN